MKTKWHLEKFKKAKPGCCSRCMSIGWLHEELMIGSHQINFRKNCGSFKGGSKALDMWDWIAVRLGDVV